MSLMIRTICMKQWNITALTALLIGLAVLLAVAQTAHAKTVKDLYPLLSDRFIKSAKLTTLENDLILKTDTGIVLTHTRMKKTLDQHDPRLKNQLENNLIFLAEQEILTLILENEVKKSGMADGNTVTQEQIAAFLQSKVADQTVSEQEVKAFYNENKEMVGGLPFDQVSDSIKQFLLDNKQQTAVRTHIHDLGQRHQIRINEKWLDAQYKRMTDNPVDKARLSGKPTMVEFGAAECIPCKMMAPILEKLESAYRDRAVIAFIDVWKHRDQAPRFGIRAIPTQVFFDPDGKEVHRHMGFMSEAAIVEQLTRMGVEKPAL